MTTTAPKAPIPRRSRPLVQWLDHKLYPGSQPLGRRTPALGSAEAPQARLSPARPRRRRRHRAADELSRPGRDGLWHRPRSARGLQPAPRRGARRLRRVDPDRRALRRRRRGQRARAPRRPRCGSSREVARVLKPGGVFLAKTPNAWHYVPTIARFTPLSFHRFVCRLRGRASSHTFPTRYRANTRPAITAIGVRNGSVLESYVTHEDRPEDLRITAPTYVVGWMYERAVNTLPGARSPQRADRDAAQASRRSARRRLRPAMHLLFLTDNFPPETNAPATRGHEHARRWVQAGHRVTVITCAPNFPEGKVHAGYENRWHQREVIDGIEAVRVKSFIAANKGFAARILDYVSFMLTGSVAGLFVERPDVALATSPQFLRGRRLGGREVAPAPVRVRGARPVARVDQGRRGDAPEPADRSAREARAVPLRPSQRRRRRHGSVPREPAHAWDRPTQDHVVRNGVDLNVLCAARTGHRARSRARPRRQVRRRLSRHARNGARAAPCGRGRRTRPRRLRRPHFLFVGGGAERDSWSSSRARKASRTSRSTPASQGRDAEAMERLRPRPRAPEGPGGLPHGDSVEDF